MREWITGRNPVFEILQTRRRQIFRLLVANGTEEKGKLAEILSHANRRRLPVQRVPRQQLDALSEGHQGVALEVSGYPYADYSDILKRATQRQEMPLILLLDMLQNPQNLGTLLRTAEAAGVHGVIIPPRRAAGITPAVVHASAGATEHLLVAQMNLAQAIDWLQKAGVWVVGLSGEAPHTIQQAPLDRPLALVVGNEGEGMRALVAKKCDMLVNLPMRGQIESLNAAVAGSIALYLAMMARQQTKKDKPA
ncbi:rRNA methylase, putative, group 3 [Bellilinea caldifistulae]|uniref:RNA methyltransferase n=1 Tax=Bellilinea caldifistulae TaxID=360411 RepID=A0A0P6XIQ1_9CHLR|nr:23S rRNA (guanosine(2251)-2'-O)-methyltransferase RlmB [Bellilinea caldifistulae]KPL75416.1 RNA methyltransferase [Bellilinea caldifistulae]GAP09855.1 rRNA methylase, putative, group 3 [Bellilinea caldifistulae]